MIDRSTAKLRALSPVGWVIVLGLCFFLAYETLVLVAIYFTPDALGTMGGDSIHFSREIANDLQGRWFKAGGLETDAFYDASTNNSWGWVFVDHVSVVHPIIVVPLTYLVGQFIHLPGVWVIISSGLGTLSLAYATKALSLSRKSAVLICALYFATPHIALSNNSSLFVTKGYPDILIPPLIIVVVAAALTSSRVVLVVAIALIALTKEVYIVPAVMLTPLVFVIDKRLGIGMFVGLVAYGIFSILMVPWLLNASSHFFSLAESSIRGGGNPTEFTSKRMIFFTSGILVPLLIAMAASLMGRPRTTQLWVLIALSTFFLIGGAFTGFTGHSSVTLVGLFIALVLLSLHRPNPSETRLFSAATYLSVTVGLVAVLAVAASVFQSAGTEIDKDFAELRKIQSAIPLGSLVAANIDARRESVISARAGYYRFPLGLDKVEYLVLPVENYDSSIPLFFKYDEGEVPCSTCRTASGDADQAESAGFVQTLTFDNYAIWEHTERLRNQ